MDAAHNRWGSSNLEADRVSCERCRYSLVCPKLHIRLPPLTNFHLLPVHTHISHLAALRNDDVLRRLAFRVSDSPRVLDLVDHVHAVDDVAKDNVLAVEMGRAALRCDDEELAAVGVGTC
jgi:hypothetical protein